MFFIRTSVEPLTFEVTHLLPEDRIIWVKNIKTYYVHRDGIKLGFSLDKEPDEFIFHFRQPTRECEDMPEYFRSLVRKFGYDEIDLCIRKKIEDENYIIFAVDVHNSLATTS